MNISKLLKIYIRDNPNTGINKYYKNIIHLMGRYIVSKINKQTMIRLLSQLDYMQYEAGYVIANEQLLLNADIYRNRKMNLRKQYHITSSTLFNVLEGRRVSIPFAIDFCKINNLKLKDNFIVYSEKKTYSIQTKANIKLYLKKIMDYALKKGLITNNPVPLKYRFIIDDYRRTNLLSKQYIKDFIDAVFKYRNRNASIMILIYIIIGLNRDAVFNMKIKDIDLKRNCILLKDEIYNIPECVSDFINVYFVNEDPNNYILNVKMRSYIKTMIYKIKDSINRKSITVESLKDNYQTVMEILKEYKYDSSINSNNYKELGLESKMQYNDFKEFLRLKKIYEGR